LCELYVTSDLSKSEIQRRYGLKGKSALLNWLRKFGYLDSNSQIISKPPKPKPDTSESEELRLLKARLKEAELKAEAYQRMIRNAEKDYKISIEKKDDTK
jgi:transposase-like protein